jgi:flavorubredoxin
VITGVKLMAKALIVCATRTGETRQIGDLIAEGLRIAGVEAVVKDAKYIKQQSDLDGYDALVFGSATYHGDMMQGMKTMLFLAENTDLEGKVGGAFGAFGWSGEAPDRIYDTMKHIFKMSMVNEPLRLKTSSIQGGIEVAQNYGKEIAGKLTN